MLILDGSAQSGKILDLSFNLPCPFAVRAWYYGFYLLAYFILLLESWVVILPWALIKKEAPWSFLGSCDAILASVVDALFGSRRSQTGGDLWLSPRR